MINTYLWNFLKLYLEKKILKKKPRSEKSILKPYKVSPLIMEINQAKLN